MAHNGGGIGARVTRQTFGAARGRRELLAQAEQDSFKAVRFLWFELLAALLVVVLMPVVLGALALTVMVGSFAFFSTMPPPYLWLALYLVVALALVAPVFILARVAGRASAPGVSVALNMRATGQRPDLSAYPRMEYALSRLVEHGGEG